MFQKYSLEIVSHHRDFSNKVMRQYYVDGINTIGAYGDEPFEVRFKNHTSSKVQVKLSIDGTDLITGEKATTEVSNDMWFVKPYGTLNLKAWPETQNGGAALIFTSATSSVAIHTHGDLSCRGIIAAAVFEEGQIPPSARFVEKHVHHWNHHYYNSPYWVGNGQYSLTGDAGSFTMNSIMPKSASASLRSAGDVTYSSASNSGSVSFAATEASAESESLESLAAVGAGQYVDQKITYVTGLIKPIFTETVRVRYLWWDDLVAKLNNTTTPEAHASGFPGDKPNGINLGNTPRIGNYNGDAFPRKVEPTRFHQIDARI